MRKLGHTLVTTPAIFPTTEVEEDGKPQVVVSLLLEPRTAAIIITGFCPSCVCTCARVPVPVHDCLQGPPGCTAPSVVPSLWDVKLLEEGEGGCVSDDGVPVSFVAILVVGSGVSDEPPPSVVITPAGTNQLQTRELRNSLLSVPSPIAMLYLRWPRSKFLDGIDLPPHVSSAWCKLEFGTEIG